MTTALHAAQAGSTAPESDNARGANAGEVEEHREGTDLDSHAAGATDQAAPGASGQALKVIEGERKAPAYLDRLRADQVAPDELALTVAPLYGAALRGFCRVLSKELEGQHHA